MEEVCVCPKRLVPLSLILTIGSRFRVDLRTRCGSYAREHSVAQSSIVQGVEYYSVVRSKTTGYFCSLEINDTNFYRYAS